MDMDKTKDDVLLALSVLGFKTYEIEEVGYRFEYEGLNVLYSVDDPGTTCVTLSAPDVFDITGDNRTAVLEAMAKLCGGVRYVQPHIMFGEQVWLNYQYWLGEHEATPELLEHMVRVLAYATSTFHKLINGNNNDD